MNAAQTQIAKLIDQLHRSVEGDSWQGPAIREILDGLDAPTARSHPAPGAHSIWEILLHVTAWTRAVRSRLLGQVTELAGADDWPPLPNADEAAWPAAFADLRRAQAELFSTLRTFSDADLAGPVPNRDYDREFLLRGLVQHHAYHAGQMALLKRAATHPRA